MSTTIGEVNINLRMSLTQFSKDVKDGTDAARTGTQQMASEMRDQTQQAKASMALLGEEIGVRIPRHLRSFIAEIPGVGAAMSAAFSAVAVIALLEIIVKVTEKVQQWRDHLRAAQEAWAGMDEVGKAALHKLDESILSLQARIEELRGHHLEALRKELQGIDMQTLDHITEEFAKVGKEADATFKKMQVGWLANAVGFGDDKAAKDAQEHLHIILAAVKELSDAGKNAGIGPVIDAEIKRVQDNIDADENWAGAKKEVVQAAKLELDALNSLKAIYAKTNEEGADKKAIKTMEEQKRATEEAARSAKHLADELEKVEEHLSKMHETRSMSLFGTGLPSARDVDQSGLFQAGSIIGQPQPQEPQYAGTKQAMELYNIQNDSNEAVRQGQEVYTQTRTAAEQYQMTLDRLNALLQAGTIDQETYDRAVLQAAQHLEKSKAAWQEFQKTAAANVQQALLFRESWKSALENVLRALMECIVQMTIFKALANALPTTGPFAAFGAAFGGFRAGGGSVYPGSVYAVGEMGPELFAPGQSGTIIPNGALGGGHVINIDARGATNAAEVELRVRRAIADAVPSIVQIAAQRSAERGLRS